MRVVNYSKCGCQTVKMIDDFSYNIIWIKELACKDHLEDKKKKFKVPKGFKIIEEIKK